MSLPQLRTATGLDYARLQIVLHKLEFDWRSVTKGETAGGFERYFPQASEKLRPHESYLPYSGDALKETSASQQARRLVIEQRDAPWCVACHQELIGRAADAKGRKQWHCATCGSIFPGSSPRQPERILERSRTRSEVVKAPAREAVTPDISQDTKETRKMPMLRTIDLNKVEELASQGVAVNTVGIKLGMSGGWGSYQAKHNPDFLAAFNRGRATANLEPFQFRASPSTNGRPAKNGKPKNGRARIARISLSELPPPRKRHSGQCSSQCSSQRFSQRFSQRVLRASDRRSAPPGTRDGDVDRIS